MKGNRLLLMLALAVSLPAGAQRGKETIVFAPQSTPQAQFAGYYVAQEMGFYKEEGLDVVIEHPYATQSVADILQAGECQAALMPLSLAMRTMDKGLPLVNILQTSMNSATMIISRRGVDPLTLHGARVATFRAGFGQLARCYAKSIGLDYEWITSSSCVNLFVSGAVDATLARSYHEYYQLLQTGLLKKGDETGIYRFADNGFNIQQEGVYVSRKYYRKHREQMEKFARASRRGWEWTVEHPQEAVDIVMKYVRQFRSATNRILQQLMLEEVLRLQLDPDSGERSFRLRPDMVDFASGMMVEQGMLSRPISYEELMP